MWTRCILTAILLAAHAWLLPGAAVAHDEPGYHEQTVGTLKIEVWANLNQPTHGSRYPQPNNPVPVSAASPTEVKFTNEGGQFQNWDVWWAFILENGVGNPVGNPQTGDATIGLNPNTSHTVSAQNLSTTVNQPTSGAFLCVTHAGIVGSYLIVPTDHEHTVQLW